MWLKLLQALLLKSTTRHTRKTELLYWFKRKHQRKRKAGKRLDSQTGTSARLRGRTLASSSAHGATALPCVYVGHEHRKQLWYRTEKKDGAPLPSLGFLIGNHLMVFQHLIFFISSWFPGVVRLRVIVHQELLFSWEPIRCAEAATSGYRSYFKRV